MSVDLASAIHFASALVVGAAPSFADAFLGFYAASWLGRRITLGDVCRLLALAGTRIYLAFLPVRGPWRYRGDLWWLLILLGAGVGIAWWRRQGAAPGDTSPSLSRRSIVLLAVAAAGVFSAPVLRYWDVSGWMDSQSYDRFAHRIATGEAPAGNSAYMPLYQYGMAAIYFVFGHFYFVQQIANVLLGPVTKQLHQVRRPVGEMV